MIMSLSSTATFLFFLNDKIVVEDNNICLKKIIIQPLLRIAIFASKEFIKSLLRIAVFA